MVDLTLIIHNLIKVNRRCLNFESLLACKEVLWFLVLFLMDPIFFGTIFDRKKGCGFLWRLGLTLKTKRYSE